LVRKQLFSRQRNGRWKKFFVTNPPRNGYKDILREEVPFGGAV